MFERDMTNFHSPLADLLQSNSEEDSNASTSLFELINAHKSSNEEPTNEGVESLADYALKRLNLEDKNESSDREVRQSKISHELTKDCDAENSNFSTLEEYTKSFLTVNSLDLLLCVKQKPNIKTPITEATQADTTILSEKLSNIKICNVSKNETRKIDLMAALSNSAESTAAASGIKYETQFNESAFYPVKDCIIDISALADEDILYCNNDLSHFGYVISKKWNRLPLPKKCRKLGRTKPYNITQSFKFDTPSPDDAFLQARNRTTSNSKD